MWDWLRSPETLHRMQMSQNLTPHSRDALMDAIRRTLPEENRPKTFEEALQGGTLDMPTLMLLLSRMGPQQIPSTPAMTSTSSGRVG